MAERKLADDELRLAGARGRVLRRLAEVRLAMTIEDGLPAASQSLPKHMVNEHGREEQGG